MPQVPPDGLCLSAFVVLSSTERPSFVLLGKIDPAAPWDHLGSLDPTRVEAWKDRWMLPASHLLLLESPQDAAGRILRELVGLSSVPLEGPKVISEVYTPERHPTARQHWDLEFIFQGKVPERSVRRNQAWRELEFVDTRSLENEDLARTHGDILGHAGF